MGRRSTMEGGPSDAPGSLSCLALVTSLTVADLEACAARTARLAAGRHRHSAAAARRRIPPFARCVSARVRRNPPRARSALRRQSFRRASTIERADLRRACETQIKSHLVHLREGFIEAGGTPRAIADLVTASAPAFVALLRNIARLNGSTARDRADRHARRRARGAAPRRRRHRHPRARAAVGAESHRRGTALPRVPRRRRAARAIRRRVERIHSHDDATTTKISKTFRVLRASCPSSLRGLGRGSATRPQGPGSPSRVDAAGQRLRQRHRRARASRRWSR